jgi:hypothetical protein
MFFVHYTIKNIHTYIHTYLLTYSLTQWSRVLEKLTISQLVKNFLAFYWIRRFITTFTRPANCPFPEPDQSSPCSPSHFLKNSILQLLTQAQNALAVHFIITIINYFLLNVSALLDHHHGELSTRGRMYKKCRYSQYDMEACVRVHMYILWMWLELNSLNLNVQNSFHQQMHPLLNI